MGKRIAPAARPLLYICAPYTPRGEYHASEARKNVQRAIDAGEVALRHGWCPVIPHLYHYSHLRHPHTYEEWMELCIALLGRCDALWIVTPYDITPGMFREIEWARGRGIQVRLYPKKAG